jgi:hypothetical protein
VAISAAVAPYAEPSIKPSRLFRGAILFHQIAADNLYIAHTFRLFLSRINHKSKFTVMPTLSPDAFVLSLSFPRCRVARFMWLLLCLLRALPALQSIAGLERQLGWGCLFVLAPLDHRFARWLPWGSWLFSGFVVMFGTLGFRFPVVQVTPLYTVLVRQRFHTLFIIYATVFSHPIL